jgi:hypothetical protein
VEIGIDIDKFRIIEITGIAIKKLRGKASTLKNKIFRKKLMIPIRIEVIIDKIRVANIFCSHVPLLKSPIMRSFPVLAMKGPLILPLKERMAGTIKMSTEKDLKGNINIVRITPAKIEPIMEMISEGKVSLIILILESSSNRSISQRPLF